jgi:serine phosphatase RsbU (regulator of sigma subunit)
VSEIVLPQSQPLGLNPPGRAGRVDVRPGDRVLLFTDGAVEARRAGRFFPLAEAAGEALASGPLDAAVEQLGARVQEHTAGGAADDVAFLAFELPGRPVRVPTPR